MCHNVIQITMPNLMNIGHSWRTISEQNILSHVWNLIMSVLGTKYIELIDPRKMFDFAIDKLAKNQLYISKRPLTLFPKGLKYSLS